MPLPVPNLDDRDFEQLLAEATRRLTATTPGWDLSPSNPGMVLLELFAHLTETMIYRLNRLPHKAYVEFLRLMGVTLQPPAAASVSLEFSRDRPGEQPIVIPRGARVTVNRASAGSEPPVFATAHAAAIPAGGTSVAVLAHQCDIIDAELVGVGTGLPGQSVTARRPPIVARVSADLDLVVGVLTDASDPSEKAIEHDGQRYRLWDEVEQFVNLEPDSRPYVVDRLSGVITFAPAARLRRVAGRPEVEGDLDEQPEPLAPVPPVGRAIRLWYRRGGGAEGNVGAQTLTVLKDQIVGARVTNPQPAAGGRAAESLENALIRGPQELHSLQRAVTARDFEQIARQSGAVARARAVTRARLWTYAAPGTVEVLLVPRLPEAEWPGGRVTVAALQGRETEETRTEIQRTLDRRRPLGTACVVTWTRYKMVRVTARIIVRREQDLAAIKQRVDERLHGSINPLPTRFNPTGWPFGQALRASHVFDIALKEPGVRWVDRVRLLVDEAPATAVGAIATDPFPPPAWYVGEPAWYAGGGDTLFRTLNHGDGWEAAGRFPAEQVDLVEAHPERAGLVAISTRAVAGGYAIHYSEDSGESWRLAARLDVEIEDMAWLLRGGEPVLLLATDGGLYEYLRGGTPVPVLVDERAPRRTFYAVAVASDGRGDVKVAVASQQANGGFGVFLSREGGRRGSFRPIGLAEHDIRVLAVQIDGPRSFLWAGVVTEGDDPGRGCYRWELTGVEDPRDGWVSLNRGWTGGSCWSLAFRSLPAQGTTVLAATHRRGVLRLNLNTPDAGWQALDVNGGLPLRPDRPGEFRPVQAVAVDRAGRWVMAGGEQGVYRSDDGGISYQSCSSTEFAERVTLPETWLFCSGEHDVEVVGEDAANRD